jgi:uncharacterized UPF0146 family protein
VQLLTGEVPERSLFTSAEMAAALRPYFELTRAVRQVSKNLQREIHYNTVDDL